MSQEKTSMGPPPSYASSNDPRQPHTIPAWNAGPSFPPPMPYASGPGPYQHLLAAQPEQYQPYQAQSPYPAYQQPATYPTPAPWPTATAFSAPLNHHLHPQPQAHLLPFTPQPPTITSHIPLEYPYIPTAKRQMTLLSPDRTQPLLTVIYPSSWSTTPKLTIHRGGDANGPEMGGALFHSITTGKVDAYLVAPGGGKFDYHFRKKFVSHTGLGGASAGGRMKWAVEDGAMVLTEEGVGSSGGGYVARFVAADSKKKNGGKGIKGATDRLEGRLEIRRGGLNGLQFEEVFVTLVAEMERKRRDNEDWEILEAVWKHSSGGSGGEGWGGLF